MDKIVASRLLSVQFGPVQQYKNAAILPLIAPEGLLRYKTLGEALATSEFTISEISTSGSVPELLVVNRCGMMVLLLDGEELAGAKQNRVLNTSVLIPPDSKTRIPVSCTEQGRWSYASTAFSESGNVMAQKIRAMKSASVSCSLMDAGSFHSDQGEVWQGIASLQAKASVASPTSAMKDVFTSREADLRECTRVFPCIPGQVGLLAFVNHQPVGFDLFSLGSAYAGNHSKLMRSYVLESLLEPPTTAPDEPNHAATGRGFIDRVCHATDHLFPSVGSGTDVRYNGPGLAGSALVFADELIHSAFFQLHSADASGFMASLRNRRRSHFPE